MSCASLASIIKLLSLSLFFISNFCFEFIKAAPATDIDDFKNVMDDRVRRSCAPNGSFCSSNSACCGGLCYAGFCSSCMPKGVPCYFVDSVC
eukprot:Pgem_evm1s15442